MNNNYSRHFKKLLIIDLTLLKVFFSLYFIAHLHYSIVKLVGVVSIVPFIPPLVTFSTYAGINV